MLPKGSAYVLEVVASWRRQTGRNQQCTEQQWLPQNRTISCSVLEKVCGVVEMSCIKKKMSRNRKQHLNNNPKARQQTSNGSYIRTDRDVHEHLCGEDCESRTQSCPRRTRMAGHWLGQQPHRARPRDTAGCPPNTGRYRGEPCY